MILKGHYLWYTKTINSVKETTGKSNKCVESHFWPIMTEEDVSTDLKRVVSQFL